MSLQTIAQMIVYGLTIGALYGVAAIGFALIMGVMKIGNIAHGSLIVIGGYVGFWLFRLFGIDPFISIPLVGMIMFLLGLIIYQAVFSRLSNLQDFHARLNVSLLLGFGLMLILDNGVLFLWTADERRVNTDYSGKTFELFGTSFPYVGIACIFITFLIVMCLHVFLKKTYFGKGIIATSKDWQAAGTMGIPVAKTYGISFGLGVALAGIAGSLLVVNFAVSYTVSLEWLLKATIVLVLAGMGNIWGVFVVGLLLGVVESLGVIIMGVPYRELVGLTLFLLILLFKPSGLFARR